MGKISYGLLFFFIGIIIIGLDFLGFFSLASFGLILLPIFGPTPLLLAIAIGSILIGILLFSLGDHERQRADHSRSVRRGVCEYCGGQILGRSLGCKKCTKVFCGERCAMKHFHAVH